LGLNREGRKADRRGQPNANTLSVAFGPTRDFGNIGGLFSQQYDDRLVKGLTAHAAEDIA